MIGLYFLAHQLIKDIIKVASDSNNRSDYDQIKIRLRNSSLKPPQYFKLGLLKDVDEEKKVIKIQVSDKAPIANCGDGVTVNTKGARDVRNLYGLETPDYRCAELISSGTIKRLATSKTMNVPEVSVNNTFLMKDSISRNLSFCTDKNYKSLKRVIYHLKLCCLIFFNKFTWQKFEKYFTAENVLELEILPPDHMNHFPSIKILTIKFVLPIFAYCFIEFIFMVLKQYDTNICHVKEV